MFEVYLYLLVSKFITNDFGLFLLNLHFLNMTCCCFILPFGMLWGGSLNQFHKNGQVDIAVKSCMECGESTVIWSTLMFLRQNNKIKGAVLEVLA